ncbi:MAG: Beta-galactosidase C-terminal domain, partial [Lactobacillus sp.]|uniref:Beta-galactosidase C-terminal domain n=1 Tax=Lactobacillus sp. TaxID=1591 RepID=UPI0023D399F1
PICKSSNKVSIQVRENENTQYWFVQNFSNKEAKIKLDKELLDLVGGKKDKGEVTLKPFESKVYSAE